MPWIILVYYLLHLSQLPHLLYLLWTTKSQRSAARRFRRAADKDAPATGDGSFQHIAPNQTRFRKKPDWVPLALIRLKALCPDASTRHIQALFNRREAATSGESVSHSYVAYTLKANRYRIHQLRQHLRHRQPKPLPKHLFWAMDLTFLPSACGRPQAIAGIIEHASRANLVLTALRTKTSARLLRVLADAIDTAQAQPRWLQTDNEPVFTSRAFRFGLWLCGIRHRTTDPASPWQNGRVERFFGTFKQKARGLVFHSPVQLNEQLALFRCWYNHFRPHQHLGQRTPFEAYHSLGIQYAQPGETEYRFSVWQNRLNGFFYVRE